MFYQGKIEVRFKKFKKKVVGRNKSQEKKMMVSNEYNGIIFIPLTDRFQREAVAASLRVKSSVVAIALTKAEIAPSRARRSRFLSLTDILLKSFAAACCNSRSLDLSNDIRISDPPL